MKRFFYEIVRGNDKSKIMLTFFSPCIEASIRAIFANNRAFPPSTARNWKPIGTRTMPMEIMPNIIIVII